MADKRLQQIAKAHGVDRKGNKPTGDDPSLKARMTRLEKENRALWTTLSDMECDINNLEEKFRVLQDEIEELKERL